MYYVLYTPPTQAAPPAMSQKPCSPNPQIMSRGGLRVGGWVELGHWECTNIRALRHSLFVHFVPIAAPSTESGPFGDIEYSHKHHRTTLCSCVIQFQNKSQRKNRNWTRHLRMEVKLWFLWSKSFAETEIEFNIFFSNKSLVSAEWGGSAIPWRVLVQHFIGIQCQHVQSDFCQLVKRYFWKLFNDDTSCDGRGT